MGSTSTTAPRFKPRPYAQEPLNHRGQRIAPNGLEQWGFEDERAVEFLQGRDFGGQADSQLLALVQYRSTSEVFELDRVLECVGSPLCHRHHQRFLKSKDMELLHLSVFAPPRPEKQI